MALKNSPRFPHSFVSSDASDSESIFYIVCVERLMWQFTDSCGVLEKKNMCWISQSVNVTRGWVALKQHLLN